MPALFHLAALLWMMVSAGKAAEPSRQAERRAQQTKEFNKWMRSWHPINRKLKVVEVPNMGRGVIATQDIAEGDRILAVPLKYVFCRETILRALDASWQHTAAAMSETELLVTYLLMQRALKQSSIFYRWIVVLPRNFNTPVTWSTEDIKMLEFPSAESRIQQLRWQVDADYRKLRDQFLVRHFSEDEIAQRFSYKRYLWARSVVSTRAWNMQGRQYLVPMAGMFNHAPDAEDYAFRWETATGQRSQKFLKYHQFETLNGRVVQSPVSNDATNNNVLAIVFADRNCKSGEEVFESYGDNTNDIYLNYHGFVPVWNPYECFDVFHLPFGDPKDALLTKRRSLLQKFYLPPPQTTSLGGRPLMCLHEGELSDKLLAYFIVGLMSINDLNRCQIASSLTHLKTCSGNAELITLAYGALAQWLTAELGRFSTTLQDDLEQLESGSLSEPQQAAVRYRYTQKKILHSIQTLAQQYMNTGDPKAQPMKVLPHYHDEL